MFSELSLSICFLYLAFSESTNLGESLPARGWPRGEIVAQIFACYLSPDETAASNDHVLLRAPDSSSAVGSRLPGGDPIRSNPNGSSGQDARVG